MGEAFFKIRAGDQVYQLDKLRLGDLRTLRNEFGVTDLEALDTADPNALAGIFYCAVRRMRPGASHAEILAEVDDIDVLALEEDVETEADPPRAEEAEDAGAAVPTPGS